MCTAMGAQGTKHSVSLSWKPSPDAAKQPQLRYNVYRADSPCSPSASFKRIALGLTTTSYNDPDVAPGSYCYQVKSVVNGREGLPSNQASAVVPSQAFAIPLSTTEPLILIALVLVVVGFYTVRSIKTHIAQKVKQGTPHGPEGLGSGSR
jgi:hypothetical protein